MGNGIAVLPLGAYEQHGRHLPLETDSMIAKAIIETSKRYLTSQSVSFLPVEPIGYSIEHMRDKRSKTLSYSEAIERWIGIGKGCYANGTRKLVILNAHGGNSPLMSIVATELRARYKMLCVTTSWGRFGLPNGLISDDDKQLDIHAGFIETSMMLAIAPEQVDMTKADNFDNRQRDFIREFNYLRAYGPQSFGWMMFDLNNRGAAGNAKRANAAAGCKIIDHAARQFAKLLEDVDHFDLNIFE